MHRITIPEGTDISRRQWQQAWDPRDILIQYFVVSFVLAGVLLLPLAWMVGTYALAIFILFPVLGILLGIIIWRRSCTAVNTAYQEVLDDITNWDDLAGDERQVWASELNGSGEQYCVEPARKYSLTYIEAADEYTLIEEVTVDFANLESSTKSEKTPSHQIVSQSFESGTFRLRSSRGIWEIDGLKSQ
jgi:hypothetical protein